MEEIRLNKYIASCGFCSRREADALIESGQVLINGKPALMGQKVTSGDEVIAKGRKIVPQNDKSVYAYYKPVGVTVTRKDSHAERILYDELDIPDVQRLKYAGRLDRDSEGLLLLTADGELIERMMRGSNQHEKEYLVTLEEEPTAEDIHVIEQGVFLTELDRKTRPCKITICGKRSVTMVLREGLNREIRRLWELRGKRVVRLKRIRVMNILLGDLKPGKWRKITEEEYLALQKLLDS